MNRNRHRKIDLFQLDCPFKNRKVDNLNFLQEMPNSVNQWTRQDELDIYLALYYPTKLLDMTLELNTIKDGEKFQLQNKFGKV